MQTVKAVIRLEFADAWQPWLDLRAMFRAAEGQETAEIRGDPIVLLRNPDKQRVVLTVKSASVEAEAAETAVLLRAASETIAQLDTAVAFPKIANLRIDTLRIDGFELPFHELTARIKDRFLRATEYSSKATDVALVLEQTLSESQTDHLQIGPMVPAQLNQQFMAFPREDLPDPFLFLSLARTIAVGGPYSNHTVGALILDFCEWADATSESLASYVRS